MKYPELTDAVRLCIKVLKDGSTSGIPREIFNGKSDMKSAFRNLNMKKEDFQWLLMKARNPLDNKCYYFFDKCLPFGASISCAHFQDFSNCVAHIFRIKSGGEDTVNYLDDFFFAALIKALCDGQMDLFLRICEIIRFPISMEKTVWGCPIITFLGLLIDTCNKIIGIPIQKITKATELINTVLKRKKVTVLCLQNLCGYLNFLCKAVIPGRVFTRRLYTFTSIKGKTLKEHHHVWVNAEMHKDLGMWLEFLKSPNAYARPFADYDDSITAKDIDFYTDATKNKLLGFGGICGSFWMSYSWPDPDWIEEKDPSIEYLELYAVVAGVLSWINHFAGSKVLLHCDNESVCYMIENNSANCKNCMYLLRLLILEGLKYNTRFESKHVDGSANYFADFLSRHRMDDFWKKAAKKGRSFNEVPSQIDHRIWPLSKIWID